MISYPILQVEVKFSAEINVQYYISYWEHKAYCLPISFILAGIKAVFSTKEFEKEIWYEVPRHI